ncbi:MAG: YcxB family protein [Bryobacteraceae bacterium]
MVGFLVLLGVSFLVDTINFGFRSGAGLIPLVMLPAFLFGQPWLMARAQINAAAHMKEIGLYEFTLDGFKISRPSVEVAQPWKSLYGAVELKDSFLLFISRQCFHTVPKRFIPADTLPAWREFVMARLAESGKKIE